jgi:hypothetical protein
MDHLQDRARRDAELACELSQRLEMPAHRPPRRHGFVPCKDLHDLPVGEYPRPANRAFHHCASDDADGLPARPLSTPQRSGQRSEGTAAFGGERFLRSSLTGRTAWHPRPQRQPQNIDWGGIDATEDGRRTWAADGPDQANAREATDRSPGKGPKIN